MSKLHFKPNFEYSTIVQVTRVLESCFKDLNINITSLECEKLGCFLNGVYGTRNRAFHDIHHALDVSSGCGPLGRIAGLMHDVVYLQVDRSHLPELRSLFGVFDPGEKMDLVLPENPIIQQDPWAQALIKIFGYSEGQKLGVYSGLNEFLSGWIAIQKLRDILTPIQLVQVIACIEATIPFRGEMKNPTSSEKLKQNIQNALHTLNLTMSEHAIDDAIIESVKISNNDIKGFGLEEPEVFIHNSWALLYESNPALQNSYFSIIQYREPLQRLEGFLAGLTPEKIFTQYHGFPCDAHMILLHQGAIRNLRMGREYVQAKLLDTALLEAFAMLSGGDCPLELFTGPKPRKRESKTARIEQFLNWSTIKEESHGKDEKVIRLLNDGRAFRSKFDVKTALLAAYLYSGLTDVQFKFSYSKACEFFKREISAEEFLATLPDEIVIHIGNVLSHIACTRADAIQTYLRRRKNHQQGAA